MNEVISVIVAALASGATAGLKDTVSQSFKEAYAGLKGLIQSKYTDVRFVELERDPNSEVSRSDVKTDLINAGALQDFEFLRKAQELMDVIRTCSPEVANIVGLKVKDLDSASLTVEDIVSKGPGVVIDGATVKTDVKISGVRAGQGTSNPKA